MANAGIVTIASDDCATVTSVTATARASASTRARTEGSACDITLVSSLGGCGVVWWWVASE